MIVLFYNCWGFLRLLVVGEREAPTLLEQRVSAPALTRHVRIDLDLGRSVPATGLPVDHPFGAPHRGAPLSASLFGSPGGFEPRDADRRRV